MITQVYFWNFLFQKLVNYSSSEETKDEHLTILICAKNEYHQLQKLIPKLLQQAGNIDILVVDDFSDDDSLLLLSAFANEFSSVAFISASKNVRGKKQALIDGLSSVKTKWVLLTDADCQPVSDQWAMKMLAAAKNKEIVLGYSPYGKTRGFLNRWIRYEAVLTAIQYFSYSLAGKTYMGVGRNLLYSTQAVESGKKLADHMDLLSGDDDLLVNSIASNQNVAIQIDPKSWVISQPKETLTSYINQKRRHLSTATRYKKSHQSMLLIFSMSWILLYLSMFVLLFIGMGNLALLLFLLRMLSTYLSNIKLFPKLGFKDSLAHWWYLDPCTAVYFLFFSIFVILPQKEAW